MPYGVARDHVDFEYIWTFIVALLYLYIVSMVLRGNLCPPYFSSISPATSAVSDVQTSTPPTLSIACRFIYNVQKQLHNVLEGDALTEGQRTLLSLYLSQKQNAKGHKVKQMVDSLYCCLKNNIIYF
jgi:hypothetical protein